MQWQLHRAVGRTLHCVVFRFTVQVYGKSHMTKAYFKRFQVKYRCRRGQFSVGNHVCNNNAYMVIKDSHLEGGEQFGEPACRYCLNQCVHCLSCSDVYSPMCIVQLGKLTIGPGFVLPLRTRTSTTPQSTAMLSDLYPLLLSPCLDQPENPALPYNSHMCFFLSHFITWSCLPLEYEFIFSYSV